MTTKFVPLCSMCLQLHLEDHFGLKQKSIEDVEEIWNVNNHCEPVNSVKIVQGLSYNLLTHRKIEPRK